ncbi:Uu.00g059570.m01.CDS01 [Anthostomella pinea]|uniref:Uu.00g059570.m01.CDS01 n=1 Tax=Anthostomella pinea TaxID=933095 RepID=A0AAI8VS38_9PEZI|nr:Uu.00g059570.m01.CDS01 [Anthostomella pinea]
MAEKKLITVFGATGLQGDSVVETFLNDPKLREEWAVRGVTRDVNKASAKELAKRGADVVSLTTWRQGDMNDTESLVKAMKGSHTVFANTNYWEACDKAGEVQQGKNLADAAKEAGVQHYIWSTLENVNKQTNGRLPDVYHFDSKAEVDEHVKSLGIPATLFLAGFYMSNFFGVDQVFRPVPPDNTWTMGLPMAPSVELPLFHTDGADKYIKAIVNNRHKLLGQKFLGATNYMTPQGMLDGFKTAFPKAGATARYVEMAKEECMDIYRNKGAPEYVALEVYEMFRFYEEAGYYGGASLGGTHALVEDPLTTWDDYLRQEPACAGLE